MKKPCACGAVIGIRALMSGHLKPTVLHFTGAENDQGGIVSVVRALATSDRFVSVLGVGPGFIPRRPLPLPTLEFARIAAEVIGLRTWWRARVVAQAVREWLAAGPSRVFHGHSRAGLLVAWQLAAAGESRVVASVHCYGRQRWFYRRAARRLGRRLFWLSPAMKHHYGIKSDGWTQCIPGCVTERSIPFEPRPAFDGTLRLGGIGTLVAWKRWHDVLAALARLPTGVRERVTFRHIGSPDTSAASRAYAQELYSQTASLGLETQVSWLGEQPDSQGLLNSVACVLVTAQAEPFSIALLETIRAGVPVLAADSGGTVDVVRPGETGGLFRTGDVAELAQALTALVQTDALKQVRITRETIRPFTVPVIAAQWAAVYAGLGVEIEATS